MMSTCTSIQTFNSLKNKFRIFCIALLLTKARIEKIQRSKAIKELSIITTYHFDTLQSDSETFCVSNRGLRPAQCYCRNTCTARIASTYEVLRVKLWGEEGLNRKGRDARHFCRRPLDVRQRRGVARAAVPEWVPVRRSLQSASSLSTVQVCWWPACLCVIPVCVHTHKHIYIHIHTEASCDSPYVTSQSTSEWFITAKLLASLTYWLHHVWSAVGMSELVSKQVLWFLAAKSNT